jgi:hypothetical protein
MSSHLTKNLDRGVRRLLNMWPVVKKELEQSFIAAEDLTLDASIQVVTVDAFKRVLMERCGVTSATLAKARNEGKITINATGRPTPALQNRIPAKSVDSTASPKDAKGVLLGRAGSKGTPEPELLRPTASDSPKKGSLSMSMSPSDSVTSLPSLPAVPIVVEPLTAADVDMLALRFDLSSMVHYGHVLQYFKELYRYNSHILIGYYIIGYYIIGYYINYINRILTSPAPMTCSHSTHTQRAAHRLAQKHTPPYAELALHGQLRVADAALQHRAEGLLR